MRFDPALVIGRLRRRYKRFLADVELADGSLQVVHCPNPGSMLGLLDGEPAVHLAHFPASGRKLAYGMELIQLPDTLVGVNPVLTNRFVAEALDEGQVPGVGRPREIRREIRHGESTRFDFGVVDEAGRATVIEVKSVTLADRGVAYFPDAVTVRGQRHVRELGELAAGGGRALLLFWVNRGDCHRMRPADWIDPAYGRELREAAAKGLEIVALSAHVSVDGIRADRALPVDLSPQDTWSDPPRWTSRGRRGAGGA